MSFLLFADMAKTGQSSISDKTSVSMEIPFLRASSIRFIHKIILSHISFI